MNRALRAAGRRIASRLGLAGPPANPSSLAWIDFDDQFLNWLSFANAGMLHRGNVHCMEHALEHLPPGSAILEIGTFCGLSANVLAYLKRKRNLTAPLYTCDEWRFEGAVADGTVGHTQLSHREYREFVRASCIRNEAFFSRDDPPHTFEMNSARFFDAWRAGERHEDVHGRQVELGGLLGFCFIDGDHRYDGARLDFEGCDALLVPGGFLLFDDSADGSGWEVCRLMEEILTMSSYELVAKNPNYLFRKKG